MDSAVNWTVMEARTPKPAASATAYHRVCVARPGFPAPMFGAPRAETVESMEDGIRNRKLMTFSTMPTAAASLSPRWLAMMVMTRKAIWMRPS